MEWECRTYICNRRSRKWERIVDTIFKESVAEILSDLMKCVKHRLEELWDYKAR